MPCAEGKRSWMLEARFVAGRVLPKRLEKCGFVVQDQHPFSRMWMNARLFGPQRLVVRRAMLQRRGDALPDF